MRTGVIAVAAACAAAAAPGAAFLHAPSIGRAHGIAPLISLRSSPPRARSAATALRMSGEDDGRRAAKVLEMRRLAEEAAKALAEASLAEEKASAMRRERGQKSMTLNRGSDIRTKQLLGSVSEVLYKTWNSVLAGRPEDEAHDFLGLAHGDISKVSEQERRQRVIALFEKFDTDSDGRIDSVELAVGVKEVLGFDADEEQLKSLMREVDADDDGKIDTGEFTKVCFAMMSKAEAVAMAAADAAAAEEEVNAKRRTFTSVMESFDSSGALSAESFPKVALVGNASAAVSALDLLKKQGNIALWDSGPKFFQSTGADRMKAVTGMVAPEKDLGLAVDGFTRFRYQGVSFLGITGAFSLLVAGFPGPWSQIGITPDMLASYGYGTFLVNLIFTSFAPQFEKINMERLLKAEGDMEDRWLRKQAGRLIGAYLCGVPVESVTYDPSTGLPEILIFSKKTGNIDIESLRQAAAGSVDGFLQLGLTKQEVDRQSVIQMMGLVAEYRRYGKATIGYRFFRELDDQLDLSQSLISRRDKQVQARFGVTSAFQLLDRHAYAFEQVVEALKAAKTPAESLALFESAVTPPDWVEVRGSIAHDEKDAASFDDDTPLL